MPVTKSATKTLRRDRRRTSTNLIIKRKIKTALKKVINQPNKKNLSSAFTILDRAVKKKLIHKNKAARFKSRLSKLMTPVKPRAKAK